MENNKKKMKKLAREFPVWNYDQARHAIPYIQSVVRSLRETYLELRQYERQAQRLADKPGRPTRQDMVDHEEAVRAAERLAERLEGIMEELHELNMHAIDPVNGIVMIPVSCSEKLAWLIFDLFDKERISSWRYHNDPISLRRPIGEASIDVKPIKLLIA